MPNPENIVPHQFKPGQSGNPAGYSRGRRITDRLMRAIEEDGRAEELVRVWLGAALGDETLLDGNKPDFAFFKELLDRLEGKVTAPVSVTTDEKPPGENADAFKAKIGQMGERSDDRE